MLFTNIIHVQKGKIQVLKCVELQNSINSWLENILQLAIKEGYVTQNKRCQFRSSVHAPDHYDQIEICLYSNQ